MPPMTPSPGRDRVPDPDRLAEQRSVLARAAQAGSARRSSRAYAHSAGLSRRNLLRTGAFGGLAVAAAGSLSACGVDPKYPVVPESLRAYEVTDAVAEPPKLLSTMIGWSGSKTSSCWFW